MIILSDTNFWALQLRNIPNVCSLIL
jgi:hypothetical protein